MSIDVRSDGVLHLSGSAYRVSAVLHRRGVRSQRVGDAVCDYFGWSVHRNGLPPVRVATRELAVDLLRQYPETLAAVTS